MKLPWDKKQLVWGLTAFLTVAASVLFYMLLKHWSIVGGVFKIITDSLRPITYGLILSYLLNPLMNLIENRLILPVFKKIFAKKQVEYKGAVRFISIIMTWVIVGAFVLSLIYLVVPEFIQSVEKLVSRIPEYAEHLLVWIDGILGKSPHIYDFFSEAVSGFATNVTELFNRIMEAVPEVGNLLAQLSSSLYNVFIAIVNVLIGVIVTFYVLKDKERFVAQGKKIIYSMCSIKHGNEILRIMRMTHEKFGNFIVGKIFDSIIIGILCFIILEIFDISYSLLVSVIVGVTNVIPFFGPFIGAIPSALLILFVDPIDCITFVIIILLLQQFDGNILGPKILGSTTGISSFWVLTSILVGSALFGVWGMVCSVPFFAVIYALVDEICIKTLKSKGLDYSTNTFEKIKGFDEKTKAPEWKK